MTTGYETELNPAWPPPAPAPVAPPARPRRSGWVTAAAVVLFVAGTLSAVMGLILLILGVAMGSSFTGMMEGQPGMSDVNTGAMSGFFTGFMLGFALIALLWAAAHVAAGVGVLAGRGWARITGMVLAVIGAAFSLLGLIGTIASLGATEAMMSDPEFAEIYGGATPEEMMGATIITSLLFIVPFVVGYLIVFVVLIRNGAFFDRPRSATSSGVL